jgi:hypothetical protein
MLGALARIEAPEAAAAMATLAQRKRGFLSRGGLSLLSASGGGALAARRRARRGRR